MKTDPAKVVVSRLLEAGEDKTDWSPDPQAEPIRYKGLVYPLSIEELRKQTENGKVYLRGTVEVPRVLWYAHRGLIDSDNPDALSDYVSELVTGNATALEAMEFRQAHRPPKDQHSIVLDFTANATPFLRGKDKK